MDTFGTFASTNIEVQGYPNTSLGGIVGCGIPDTIN